jgi:hypothetical protein
MTDDNKYWQEVFRILDLARTHSGDDLLEKCLNGRTKTVQTVTQLFKLARLHFEVGGVVSNKILEACSLFLGATMSDAELEKLRNPYPKAGAPGFRSVLDEIREEGRS